MDKNVVIAVSWVLLALLAATFVVFVVLTVKKAKKEKTMIKLKSKETWFLFLPLFVANWVIYFMGLTAKNNLSVSTNLIWSAAFALKSFGFSFAAGDVSGELMQIGVYSAAFNIAGLFAQLSVILFFFVFIFSALGKKLKYAQFYKEDSYVLVGDEKYIGYFMKNLPKDKKDKNILIFVDGEAKSLNGYEKGGVIIERGKNPAKFIASMLKKDKKARTVYFASLYQEDDENIRLAAVLTDVLKQNEGSRVRIQAAFRSDRRCNYVMHESAVKMGDSTIYFFKSGTLIANEFALSHPIVKDLPAELIDRENALLLEGKEVLNLFVGMGEANYHILKNSVACDVFYGHAYKARLYDIHDSKQLIDTLKVNTFNIFEEESVKGAIAPFEDKFSITAEQADVHTESFLQKVAKDVEEASFTRIIVNLGDVAMNISIAISIRNRLRKEGLSKKSIVYVGVSDGLFQSYSKLLAAAENDAPILPLGEEAGTYTESLIWKTDVDALAKKINAFYCQDSNEEESWNGLDFFTQNSNRSVAYNLRNKFNMLGFDIEKGEFDEEAYAAFEKQYREGKARENLAKEEHLRWNAFHFANGWKPMKKAEIAVVDGLVKMKNPTEKKHACLTSVEGLDLLAAYGKELGEKYSLTEKAVKKTDTFRFDFTVMDNARTILEDAGYTVKRL